jgi:hypothetical protein
MPAARLTNGPLREEMTHTSRVVFGCVFAQDALVTFQLPLMIRTIGKPVGYTNLRVCLAGSHGDARLLTVGNNLLQA